MLWSKYINLNFLQDVSFVLEGVEDAEYDSTCYESLCYESFDQIDRHFTWLQLFLFCEKISAFQPTNMGLFVFIHTIVC